ncbi:DUF4097 domain-containing protein [Bacillus sp. REN10]|uniref:DUF4097 family beta strand repeat-containing protein n=1 Tax=Bacillus sp. REN10 TaxID=2782541 RepID=UPI00193B3FAD|nr:DUF4097 domain-containing protein [Bacillus sp. REN10]
MNEEKKRILKMVEDGIITASEAVALMEALEKNERSTASKENVFDELLNFGQKLGSQMQEAGSQLNQPKDKLFQFVQSTVQKIKDFEFPLGKAVEFSHVFHEEGFVPKRLKVEMANGDLTIIPWDEQGIKAECHVKVYGAEQEEAARESFVKNSVFYARDNKLSFSIGLKLMKVDTVLYVPKEKIHDISIKLFNGSCAVQDIHAEELDVKTANGKIELKNCQVDDFEGETGNGQIYLMNCEGKRVEADSFNGAIHVIGSVADIDVKTVNGNVLCDLKTGAAHTVKAQTITGNIEVYAPAYIGMKGELRTNFGSFHLPETGMNKVSEKEEMIQKLVRFESEKEADQQMFITAETRTGMITIRAISPKTEESELIPKLEQGE